MIFHYLVTLCCSSILLIDSPGLADLPEDQAPSSESISAPTQSKMIFLNWIPITATVQRGAGYMILIIPLPHS